jgi:hypothetical protein
LKTYTEHRRKLKELIFDNTGIDISDSTNQTHFFSKEFERIFINQNYSDYKDRLLYFHYFLTQLRKIRDFKKKDFTFYLGKLSVDGTNINGEKFEILTYARLIDKSIQFLKPKHNPDFEFRLSTDSIFIECGTRQTDKKGFFIESIEQAIMNKNKKGLEQNYSNENTALHIEVSKTIYNSYGDKDFLDTQTLENIADKLINIVNYGSIVLINTFYAKEDGIVYGHPVIKYANNCNSELKNLHNIMFNLESKRVTPILKPHV